METKITIPHKKNFLDFIAAFAEAKFKENGKITGKKYIVKKNPYNLRQLVQELNERNALGCRHNVILAKWAYEENKIEISISPNECPDDKYPEIMSIHYICINDEMIFEEAINAIETYVFEIV